MSKVYCDTGKGKNLLYGHLRRYDEKHRWGWAAGRLATNRVGYCFSHDSRPFARVFFATINIPYASNRHAHLPVEPGFQVSCQLVEKRLVVC